jgi:Cu2+-exporting ATPase
LIQLKGERWSNLVAVPMFGLTVLAIPMLGPLGAASVAHSGFGNRVRVVAPLGTLNFLHLAFSNGLLIKDGRAMEELKKVDTLVFDKTGTLTREQPEVGDVLVFDDAFEKMDILGFAAAAESRLSHPLAAAIVAKAEESGIELQQIDDSHYQIGYGITVDLAGRSIRVGSLRFLEREGILLSTDGSAALERAQAQGHSLVMVAVDQGIAGAIEIQSALRPEVKQVMRGLRERGITHISIVSGDHQHTTQIVAEALGVDDYAFEVLPRQKADIVKRLQDEGRTVCFVGDGINDALAMKAANVSVSLRGATTVATDTAQVILMDGSLSRLSELFDLSKDLHKNLIRSLAILGLPAVFNIAGVFVLGFRMGASTLITNSSFFIALANAMHPEAKRVLADRESKNDRVVEPGQ